MRAAGDKIKVLIVDDSAIVRKMLTEVISAESDMEVVGTAPDPYVARDKILALNPDVLTLDIEMPRMDGLTFLKKLMVYHPLPVIVISSLGVSSCEASMEALKSGAIEVLAKPGGPYSIGDLRNGLAAKLRAAANAKVRKTAVPAAAAPSAGAPSAPVTATPPQMVTARKAFAQDVIIAIGASTGGTEAIREVLEKLPVTTPGIVITQHIPAVFSAAFAVRLNQICAMEVKEAQDGDEVKPGRVLIAPGNFHMMLRKGPNGYKVQVQDGPRVCYQRPSVDVMFASVAQTAKNRAVGVILTGMGADGAQGLLAMKKAGARTMGQNEETCVVYGMPREADRMGATDQMLALSSIPSAMLSLAALL